MVKLVLNLCVLLGCLFAGMAKADMRSAIALVKPSVVIVGTFKATNSPRFNLRGTGFAVSGNASGDTNLFVTNAHVLPQPGKEDVDAALVVQVRSGTNDLQMRTATLLEVDRIHDLALLRMDGPAVAGLRVRDSMAVE